MFARRLAALAIFAAPVALTGCDFGTLDDLSQDEAVAGTSETSTQAIAIWNNYEATDDEVKKAVAGLQGVVDRAGNRPVQVTIDPLKKSDLEKTQAAANDPSPAQGMLVITELEGCSLDKLEKLIIARNQTELYPKTYDKYERTYTNDAQAFIAGSAPTVTWKTAYTASVLSRTYEANLTGGARRIPGAAPGGGPLLLSRTILDAPAKFIAGEDAEFKQDYQIEAYWESAPNRVAHYYGLWREFRVTTLTSSSNLYINVVLGNLVDFDVRTAKVCREGAPTASF